MDTDAFLKKYGLKYEDLNPVERETFNGWLSSMEQGALTLEKVRDYVSSMRESVLMEVSNYENGSKQDLLCKARIRNYTLLLGFLSTPEKAKQQLERALAGLGKR